MPGTVFSVKAEPVPVFQIVNILRLLFREGMLECKYANILQKGGFSNGCCCGCRQVCFLRRVCRHMSDERDLHGGYCRCRCGYLRRLRRLCGRVPPGSHRASVIDRIADDRPFPVSGKGLFFAYAERPRGICPGVRRFWITERSPRIRKPACGHGPAAQNERCRLPWHTACRRCRCQR